MVDVTTRDRVDAFWSKSFDVPPLDLHAPGVRVTPHAPARAEWHGIYVLVLDAGATVFAPLDRVGPLAEAFAGLVEGAALDPATWRTLLGGQVRILGPSVHHYLTDRSALGGLARGRRINPSDFGAIAALRGSVPPAEWVESGFGDETAVMFGLFADDVLVAAANLTDGPEPAADIGVVTRPDARGRGYGAAIAATAARQALLMNGIARYRALADNAASLAIARKLGFIEYGRNIAIHLVD